MAYINPGQLLQEYFQPAVHSVLPIVPSLLATKRAQEEVALREGLAQVRWQQEAPLRAAQTREHIARAVDLESMNEIYTKLQHPGAQGVSGGLGINPEAALAHKKFGVPYETLKPVHQPSAVLGQPGKTVYGYPKPGDEVRSDTEPLAKLDYWIKGPQGWKQTSEQIPKETYNTRIKEIETQGGQINEPPEIAIQKAVEQYQQLAPLKLQQLDLTLKAKGIDTTKWNQQQRFWSTIVKDKANREIELIKYTTTSFKTAKEALEGVEADVFNEMQRIAVGQSPTYLTPQSGAQPASTSPLPMGAKGQPQAGTPPASKLKEGVITTFKNGQSWTLANGQPKQVR